MAVKKSDQKTFFLFVSASVITIGLVFLGWFFSFRDQWQSFNFSIVNFEKIDAVKNSVQDITGDFKENIQEPTSQIGNSIVDTANEIRQEAEAREAAEKLLGELVKEEIQNQESANQP
ncbi:MAG: hypothetical protein UX09_C0035G0009 [Candidatus Uhrbacteria bacterium GW2011_GWE2_45_35]|uniref:Uncharacterized protein n=2 Tax=Candidatus Uhriibacteriota TaxID=1752732 RepID=A0A0G1JG39_9BACT|nr:MAG: hypothetical protein UW63_C0029G0012 [Candidatus Uhrbacteria bacterium GW2011_GWF2_44_350]KKU07078.1 MAG: hypothetical protein UX09_C0035G0009 [Candidatus Uhrbacteria bacterium GW2011_GWE2_45_35]HBR80222.1 hypothetical protein [Candidatus Uhrbacteria bacterium]HCU31801.1 hypothetical protein [Candidatus Uhrbacteria bacterium]